MLKNSRSVFSFPGGGALIVLACISAGTAGTASAQIVTNGDFETPVVPSPGFAVYTPTTEPAGFAWDVVSGNIDHISPLLWQGTPGQSIDLNGNTAGAIAQNISTTPGQEYLITFSLAGNPGDQGVKTVQVSFAASTLTFNFNTAGRTTANMGWTAQQFNAVATSATTQLLFQSLTLGTNAGPAIDSVNVIAVPAAPAPEPGTIALLGTGLIGMVGMAIRKRRRA